MFNVMEGITKDIQQIEALIDESYKKFRSNAYDLGLLALHDKDQLGIMIGNSLSLALEQKVKVKNELETLLNEHQNMERLIEEGKTLTSVCKSEITKLENIKSEILSRLGAIALVQMQSQVATIKNCEVLNSEILREAKATKKSQASFFAIKLIGYLQLSLLKKKQPKRVLLIGRELEKHDELKNLTGEHVTPLLTQLAELNSKIDNYKKELSNSQTQLKKNQDETLNVINYKERFDDANNQMTEAAISYGFYLFENGSKWINDKTPDLELDLLSNMLRLQGEEEKGKKQIEIYKKEISIDELSLLIANDKKSISLLMSEKVKIDEEIDKLKAHITTVEDKIKALRKV